MARGSRVTINFGLSNTIEKQLPDSTTFGDLLGNPAFKAALGFGDNCVAKVDGVVQNNSNHISDGDVIDIEVRANTKA